MLTTINIKDPAREFDESVKRVMQLLRSANEYLHDRRLRRYQSQLIEEADWTIPHPILGIPSRVERSILHLPKSFSYEFVSKVGGAVWLISAPIAIGYAIQGLYIAEADILYYDASSADVSYFEGRVTEIKADRASSEPLDPFVYAYGHDNFAHEFWNEFSALLEVPERPFEKTTVMTLNATVLGLPTLLRQTNLSEKFAGARTNTLRYGVKYNAALYAAGSQLLSRKAKGIIAAACLEQHPLSGFFADDGRYRVVITLRSLYRRALNEDEAMRAVILRLCEMSDRIDIYLDGYSVPTDREGIAEATMQRHMAIGRQVSDRAAALIGSLPEGLAGRVFDGTACTLTQSIANASRCHFYISHHGTQQHKFGWLFDIPGLVHANRSILESLPSGWVQMQSEGSIRPHYVALDDIADADDPTNDRNNMPYFSNYVFADIPRFVELCANLIKDELARPQQAEPPKVEPPKPAPVARRSVRSSGGTASTCGRTSPRSMP